MSLSGFATPEGTAAYRHRVRARVVPEHFRQLDQCWLSSVGIGTYLGDEAPDTDKLYRGAVTRALELGANVIDTAINYRHQRSERADQLDRSRRNLGLDTLDIYYLHNPETQLGEVDRALFLRRIRETFVWLERAVAEEKIRHYGTATWNGYRQPSGAQDYLSLSELAAVAREVAGDRHHFRVIQLPFNLAMTEAFNAGESDRRWRHGFDARANT